MSMFLAEISFLLALAVFAAGLVLWHRGREPGSGLLRAAGAVLASGAVITALCTGYFSVRYHVQGEFDHAYPHPCARPGSGGMGPGGMGPGMMGPARMGSGTMGPGMMQQGAGALPMRSGGSASDEVAAPESEHEEHNPAGDE